MTDPAHMRRRHEHARTMKAGRDGPPAEERRQAKCRSHRWETPEVGDDDLVCAACGRRLSFYRDITPRMCGSILMAYTRQHGQVRGAQFLRAFHEAAHDACERARARPRRRLEA